MLPADGVKLTDGIVRAKRARRTLLDHIGPDLMPVLAQQLAQPVETVLCFRHRAHCQKVVERRAEFGRLAAQGVAARQRGDPVVLPALTKPTVATVVALEDCRAAVASAPDTAPLTGVRVE